MPKQKLEDARDFLSELEKDIYNCLVQWRHDEASEKYSESREGMDMNVRSECQGRAKAFEDCAEDLERVFRRHLAPGLAGNVMEQLRLDIKKAINDIE
jgi:uncharacterized protein (DUF2267 family)